MLKQHAFMSISYFSFEYFVNIFPCLLKLNLTQRYGGNGGFMQGCVAYEGVLMLNRGGVDCLIHFSI